MNIGLANGFPTSRCRRREQCLLLVASLGFPLLIWSVGKMQKAVSPSHRPWHARLDFELVSSPKVGTQAMLNIK
jgi:hypothetical protein